MLVARWVATMHGCQPLRLCAMTFDSFTERHFALRGLYRAYAIAHASSMYVLHSRKVF